jgi:hypothetical protein
MSYTPFLCDVGQDKSLQHQTASASSSPSNAAILFLPLALERGLVLRLMSPAARRFLEDSLKVAPGMVLAWLR